MNRKTIVIVAVLLFALIVGASTGILYLGSDLVPETDSTINLGSVSNRFNNLFIEDINVYDTITSEGTANLTELCMNGKCITELNGMRYVDRGDPATDDFTHADLTIDSAYHTLDLSSIIPDGVTAIQIRTIMKDNDASYWMRIRGSGKSNHTNLMQCWAQSANQYSPCYAIVNVDDTKEIEYFIVSGIDEVYVTIMGWFIPAMDAGVLDQNVNSDSNVMFGGLTVNGNISFPNQSSISVTKGTTTISTGTNTTLVYNTELWDNLGEYDTGTGVFTAKTGGIYQVNAISRWNNTNNTREYRIGTSTTGSGGFMVEEWVSGTWGRYNQNSSALIKLNAGETISIWVSQNSGGNETISDNRMSIIKVA